MCLHNIDREPACESGEGYKLVRKAPNGIYVCYDCSSREGAVTYPLFQWKTDPHDGSIIGFEGLRYRTGFHISLDEESLRRLRVPQRRYRIIKVKFRKVTATNCNRSCGVYGRQVVAREIMNLGEVTRKED